MRSSIPITMPLTVLAVSACTGDAPVAPGMEVAAGPLAAAPATGSSITQRAEMRVAPPEGPFVLIHSTIDFQPGTWFPAHVHGGPALYTIMEGAVTVLDEGVETEYGAGESYLQAAGQVLSAGNLGEEPSTMAVAFVLPVGEELITFHAGGGDHVEMPFPRIGQILGTGPLTRSAPFDVVQLVIELAPGSSVPAHAHPGPALVTVLEGLVLLRRPGEPDRLVAAGEGWASAPGEPARIATPGAAGARLVGTYLVPRGQALGPGH